MRREDVIQAFVELRAGALAVTGPGVTSGTLYTAGHEPGTIYNMEMGYPTAVCLGLALAAPGEKVVALEGDGSVVAGLGVFTTVARYSPPNLVVLVIDNGVYGTTGEGSVETASGSGTELAAVVRACGVDERHVVDVSEHGPMREALATALTEAGPWVIVARIERTDGGTRVRGPVPQHDLVETAIAFRREMIERGHL